MSDYSSGADMVRESKGHKQSFSLDTTLDPPHTPTIPKSSASGERRHTHHRAFSSPTNTIESIKGVRALAGRLRRAASPSPSSTNKEHTFHPFSSRRSFSRDEPVELETQAKGYRTFEPGEYFYNFELPIPQSLPESMENKYGSVHYLLEGSIERPGTFRSKVSGRHTVVFVRCPSDNNIEINEPIAISKPWEDQLLYDIVISGKAFPIGTRVPIAIKLIPLAKIELHRVRVYITETSEYFCKNKRVHRMEPTRKFLIQERISREGITGNLLLELGSEFLSSVDLDLECEIPETFPHKKEKLHPFSTYENIKVHHWIKVTLRISRPDPNPNSDSGKKKHYEVSIDSPIHLLDPQCTNTNVYLPAYIDRTDRPTSASPLYRANPSTTHISSVSEIDPIDFSASPVADQSPSPLFRAPSNESPPNYELVTLNESSYTERFITYQQQNNEGSPSGSSIVEPTVRSQVSPHVAVHARSAVSLHTSSTSSNSNISTQASQPILDLVSTNNSASSSRNVTPVSSRTPFSGSSSSDIQNSPISLRMQNLSIQPQRESVTSVDIVDQGEELLTEEVSRARTICAVRGASEMLKTSLTSFSTDLVPILGPVNHSGRRVSIDIPRNTPMRSTATTSKGANTATTGRNSHANDSVDISFPSSDLDLEDKANQ